MIKAHYFEFLKTFFASDFRDVYIIEGSCGQMDDGHTVAS